MTQHTISITEYRDGTVHTATERMPDHAILDEARRVARFEAATITVGVGWIVLKGADPVVFSSVWRW